MSPSRLGPILEIAGIQIFCINPPFILKGLSQDRPDGDGRRQLLAEAGARALLRRRARSVVGILGKEDMVCVRGARGPLGPAGGSDVVPQIGFLEDDTSIVPPRTAEVVDSRGNGVVDAGDGGPADHVPGRVGGAVAAGRGDAALGNSADVNSLEPGQRRLPEDKVHRTDDEAFGVQLTARLGQQRVLVSYQLTAIVCLAVRLGRDRQVLPVLGNVAECVDDVEVVDLGVGVPLAQSGGQVVAGGVDQGQVVRDGDLVVLVASGVAGVPLHGQVRVQAGDVDLLLIGAGEDKKLLGMGRGGAERVDTSLHSRMRPRVSLRAVVHDHCSGWRRDARMQTRTGAPGVVRHRVVWYCLRDCHAGSQGKRKQHIE